MKRIISAVLAILTTVSTSGCLHVAIKREIDVDMQKKYSNYQKLLPAPEIGKGRVFIYSNDRFIQQRIFAIDNKIYISWGNSYSYIDLPESCIHRIVDIQFVTFQGAVPDVHNVELNVTNQKPVYVKLIYSGTSTSGFSRSIPEVINASLAEVEMADLGFDLKGSKFRGDDKSNSKGWPALKCNH